MTDRRRAVVARGGPAAGAGSASSAPTHTHSASTSTNDQDRSKQIRADIVPGATFPDYERVERPYRGAGEIADRILGPINLDVEDLTLDVERIVDLGSHVAVLGRYGAIARASREAIDQPPFEHVWTLTGCFQIAVVIVRPPTGMERTSPTLTVSTCIDGLTQSRASVLPR